MASPKTKSRAKKGRRHPLATLALIAIGLGLTGGTYAAVGVATSASAPRFAAALLGAHLGLPSLVRAALHGIDALQVPERAAGLEVAVPRILSRLRVTGAEIHLWTINDPERMRALLALGVDGLVTDRTDLARTAVDELWLDHDPRAFWRRPDAA